MISNKMFPMKKKTLLTQGTKANRATTERLHENEKSSKANEYVFIVRKNV